MELLPLAAAVLTERGGAWVGVRSAGLRGKWVGQPARPVMIEAAAERRYDLAPHRGVQVSSGLLAWADLVLAMDRANLAALRDLADEDTLPKLALYLDDDEVPDPWGKPVCVFREGVRIIEDGVLRHLSAS